MSQVRHTHNIFHAESIDAAENYILSKIDTSSEGFDLWIPSTFYFAWRFQEFLDLAQERNQILRYGYFPDDCRLQIVPMGNPVHEAFATSLIYTFQFGSLNPATKEFIKHHIRIGRGPEGMASSSASPTPLKKVPTRNKIPDIALEYISTRSKGQRFTVIGEVGFSETYTDLVNDAYQWLMNPESDVNLVIIVDVQENRSVLQTHPSSRERIRQLAAEFGNEQGRVRYGIDDLNTDDMDDENDDQSSIRQQQRNCLKFWELKDGKPQRRGQSFDILPKPAQPVPICIPIADMIPRNYNWVRKDVLSDKIELDMDEFRGAVTRGKWSLAYQRAINYRSQSIQPTMAGGTSV